jgi:hypothetical protein
MSPGEPPAASPASAGMRSVTGRMDDPSSSADLRARRARIPQESNSRQYSARCLDRPSVLAVSPSRDVPFPASCLRCSAANAHDQTWPPHGMRTYRNRSSPVRVANDQSIIEFIVQSVLSLEVLVAVAQPRARTPAGKCLPCDRACTTAPRRPAARVAFRRRTWFLLGGAPLWTGNAGQRQAWRIHALVDLRAPTAQDPNSRQNCTFMLLIDLSLGLAAATRIHRPYRPGDARSPRARTVVPKARLGLRSHAAPSTVLGSSPGDVRRSFNSLFWSVFNPKCPNHPARNDARYSTWQSHTVRPTRERLDRLAAQPPHVLRAPHRHDIAQAQAILRNARNAHGCSRGFAPRRVPALTRTDSSTCGLHRCQRRLGVCSL